MFHSAITHDEIKSILHYIPTTGALVWAQPRGRVLKGSTAGTTIKGIRYVRLVGYLMKAADVAYFWMTGAWSPTCSKDGDGCNLRWDNIAPVPDDSSYSNADAVYTHIRLTSEGTWEVAGNMGATVASAAPITGDPAIKFVQAVFSDGKWVVVSNGLPEQFVASLRSKLDQF